MQEQNRRVEFERVVLSHLDAAYNLARWLTHSDQDAEDVVQEACLRAFRFFGGFQGGDSRAWLLMIVRNTCYTWLRQNRMFEPVASLDDESAAVQCTGSNPEELLQRSLDQQLLKHALEELPLEFREVIVLRELENLSYKEIAYVAKIPMGTVMSRLARARKQLQHSLLHQTTEGGHP